VILTIQLKTGTRYIPKAETGTWKEKLQIKCGRLLTTPRNCGKACLFENKKQRQETLILE